MPSPFAITTPTNAVRLDTLRRGEVAFTVSNILGRRLRGRPLLTPQDASVAAWLTIVGAAERDFEVAGAQQYVVQVAAPATAATGVYPFRLDMVGVENPDELFTQGPSVAIELLPNAPPPPPPPDGKDPGYITTLVGALIGNSAGGLLGAIPGGLFFLFNRNNLGAVILLALGLLIGAWLGAVFGARFALRRGGYTGDWPTATILAVVLPILAIILVIGAISLNLISSGVQSIVIMIILNEINVAVTALLARFLALWWATRSVISRQ